jgi:hypothetical protein
LLLLQQQRTQLEAAIDGMLLLFNHSCRRAGNLLLTQRLLFKA